MRANKDDDDNDDDYTQYESCTNLGWKRQEEATYQNVT